MSTELKGNLKDFLTLFGVALDLKKMLLGLVGLIFSTVLIYGISYFIGLSSLRSLAEAGYTDKKWVSKNISLSIREHHQIVIHGFEIVFHQRCKHLKAGAHEMINTDLIISESNSPLVKRINKTIPFIFGLVYLILFNIIWAYFGLGISRIATLNLAKDEIVSSKHVVEYTWKKYRDAAMAIILCAVIFLIFAICNVVGGFVGAIPLNYLLTLALGGVLFYLLWSRVIKKSLFPEKDEIESFSRLLAKFFVSVVLLIVIEVVLVYIFGFIWRGWESLLAPDKHKGFGRFVLRVLTLNYPLDFLVLVFAPLAIVSGFVMAILAVGSILGYPLMYPTVAVEGTEVYDAASRSIMYVLTRPLKYILYQVATIVTGFVSFLIVCFFGLLTLKMGLYTAGFLFSFNLPYDKLDRILSFLTGKSGVPLSTASIPANEYLSIIVLGFWLILIAGIIFSYLVSYFWSAQTLIYLLLRKEIDGIEISEIFEEPEEKPWEKEPEVEVYEPKPEPQTTQQTAEGQSGEQKSSSTEQAT
ncbi:MAG: hypothetical protein ACK4NF_03920 [Planctomycetota bacterium]